MMCFITGKRTRVGNCVSKSNRKTKRKFRVNLQKCKIYINNKCVSLKISCKGLKIIKKLNYKNSLLTNNKLKVN